MYKQAQNGKTQVMCKKVSRNVLLFFPKIQKNPVMDKSSCSVLPWLTVCWNLQNLQPQVTFKGPLTAQVFTCLQNTVCVCVCVCVYCLRAQQASVVSDSHPAGQLDFSLKAHTLLPSSPHANTHICAHRLTHTRDSLSHTLLALKRHICLKHTLQVT